MRGSAARAVVPALAVLALAAVVAVAAGGATPGGSGDRRSPSELVLDTLLTVTLLMMVFAIAMIVFALFHRKELGNILPPHHRRSSVSSVVVFLAILGLLALLHSRGLLPGSGDEQASGEGMPSGSPPTEDDSLYEPELAWIPVLVLGALAATAYAAATVAARRRRGPQPHAETAALLADALDDSLADLLAESDPRRAVIAAYARLERVLGGHGLPRRSPETPQEFLARILPQLEVDPASVRRLTDLFTWAKFSPHEVDADMKEEAIDALRTARDDLRAAAAHGAEPDSGTRTAAVGRAA